MMSEPEHRGFYPGSNTPLPTGPVEPKTPPKKEVTWDARPTTKIIKGNPVEFFTIGALALALNKSVVTIRQWISKGYIPQAVYRLPDRGNIKGRRLYTREQIQVVLALAEEQGILSGRRIDWSKNLDFAKKVHAGWKTLNTS